MIEILPPLGKYKYDTWRILPVKCDIDNSICLRSYIRNINSSHVITTHLSTVISIIKQIQASITGEAKWLIWVWRKCKRKEKYIIYKIKHQPPLDQAIGMANTKLETQEGGNQNTRFDYGKIPYSPWNHSKKTSSPSKQG
jgi:hypothetical protein